MSALEADKRKAEESIELLQQLLKQSEQQQWQLQRRVEAAEEVAAQVGPVGVAVIFVAVAAKL